jgi:polyhydroxybutyrate depolymerase
MLIYSMPLVLAVVLGVPADAIQSGNHTRSIQAGELSRPYRIHVPPSYDPQRPTPLILALHPLATNGPVMAALCGLDEKADEAGFLVAYPNGTGQGGMLHWNVGGVPGDSADDVGYIVQILDDLVTVANIDPKRVYAAGYSNGGMLSYLLASEHSDRFAAIAAVGCTMTGDEVKAKRAVSVLQFHGTADTFVPFEGVTDRIRKFLLTKSVEATSRIWAQANGCPAVPRTSVVAKKIDDGLAIKRVAYGPGRDDSEVVLYVIDGGGHTWPGRVPAARFLGKSALDLSANDLIWEFFRKHPMK